MRTGRLALLLCVSLCACACSDANQQQAALASAIGDAVNAPSPDAVAAPVWEDIARFYQAREFQPAWLRNRREASAARRAAHFLSEATSHGLNAERYRGRSLEEMLAAIEQNRDADARQLAVADVAITTALLEMGRDVAVGRVRPHQISWEHRRELPDLSATLGQSLADLPSWIRSIQPPHPEYAALRQAVLQLADSSEGADVAAKRRMQLAVNMERWRWMPDDLGARHLLVNIPSFELRAREHGQTQLAMPVVVGKTKGHETPVFSGLLETVVFSPTWNVPDTIAEKETVPAVARDPEYLERLGMEVFQRDGRKTTQIDPDDVDWSDPQEVKRLVFRQRPGAKNALGGVKFLFPNAFNVYLHDTPADSLFSRPSRAFSHGCVRLADPAGLTAYLLRDAPEWDAPAIQAAMTSGRERAVSVKSIGVPVHIAYFTAWIADDGSVRYEADVYGYDKKQSALSSASEID